MSAATCPACGGPVKVENFNEATITTGKCGYVWAAHFGGGEPQVEPCRAALAGREETGGGG